MTMARVTNWYRLSGYAESPAFDPNVELILALRFSLCPPTTTKRSPETVSEGLYFPRSVALAMGRQSFTLYARVDTDNPVDVRRALRDLVGDGAFQQGGKPGEFVVRRKMEGENAKDLNRELLSALRRVERKTRLRAEWTARDGTVYRFFDYVLKKESKASGMGGPAGSAPE
jgi:hypothetical protein